MITWTARWPRTSGPILHTHLARCAACAAMARDASAAVGFIARAEPVEPPQELLTRILFELPAAHQHARTPTAPALCSWLDRWIQPVL